jgi:mannose-1-phosphate guanylyltransferase
VVLAGGDGSRLQSLTRRLTGDDRPKQFCALTGRETLLRQTLRRVAPVIRPEHTCVLLTQKHQRYYRDQLTGVPADCRLVQPFNHGTAPAIAYSVSRIARIDPDAVIAFLPSDHHFANQSAFLTCTEVAFAEAEGQRDRVVLLGIEATAPEESYGWIEPGARTGPELFEVKRFWEKPSQALAGRLMRDACLWNSFVMVGSARAFAGVLWNTLPELMAAMSAMWTGDYGSETDALAEAYNSVPASNFSSDVLMARACDLTVLRGANLGWSDLGEPQRVAPLLDAGLSYVTAPLAEMTA